MEVIMSEFYIKLGQRIKKFREHLGITQQSLGKLMGFSRPTITQIESGERKVSADELIKLADIFSISVGVLLDLEKEPEVILNVAKNSRKTEPQIRINVPQKNLEKFKQVLMYILNKVGSKPNIGETVIYKLLYFIDFDYYEKYEEQLIGATYLKNKYGPTPVEFRKIVEKMIEEKEIKRIQIQYFNRDQNKYIPLKEPDLAKLKANEIELINDVLNRLSNMNGAQISYYSHNDVPWLTTEDQGIIEYESVFYRTAPYSVREYSEDISGD